MLSFLFSYINCKKPVYRVEIVDSRSELPKNSKFVKVPYDDGVLICAKPSSTKTQRYKGKVSDVLTKFSGKCIKAKSSVLPFEFCFEGESKTGNISLGHHANYTYVNNTLTSLSTGGSVCNQSSGETFTLSVTFQCDNAIKKEPLIPTAWIDDTGCLVKSVVKTSKLCKHIEISSEAVYDIKCVKHSMAQPEIDYDEI